MQNIIESVKEGYDMDVINTKNFRGGIILDTPYGKKFLKKIPFSKDRILFIHNAKEHLYKKQFSNIDRYICTKDELPYLDLDGDNYTLSHMVDGRECNFDSKPDLDTAVSMLAVMHKSTKGFNHNENTFYKSELGKLPKNFQKRLLDMGKMKKKARSRRGDFDYKFLEHVGYFHNLGQQALEKLEQSNYKGLVEKSTKEGYFCHHDYTHSNIILNGHKTYIINFDSCCMELKMYDLTNLIRRKMRKCNWDIKEAKCIVEEYNSIEKISADEYEVLGIMLQFPQKFWRISNRYYNSRNGWAEKIYISKLDEVIEEIKYHKNFIDNFERILPQ